MPLQPSARLKRQQPSGTRLRHNAACVSYVIGLLLVFAVSLYLLPLDTGVGRLLLSIRFAGG